jgi:hypothetical protein
VVKDSEEYEVDAERDAEELDAGYYRKLLEKAWDEVALSSSYDRGINDRGIELILRE